MFSKTTMALLGTLLGGILITGVGAGVAAVEYTSFDTDTTTIAQRAETTTESIVYEMSEGECIRVGNPNCVIAFDESVPQGSILMEITYAPELSYIDYWTESFRDEEGTTYTNLYLFTYDFGFGSAIIEHKDLILQGFKDGVLYLYDGGPYSEGDNSNKVLKVNPADESRLVEHIPDIQILESIG